MVIEYFPVEKEISISINGVDFVLIENVLKFEADKTTRGANPMLKKAAEYQDQNWEIMNFEIAQSGQEGHDVYYTYLRKKKIEKK